jgi:hypothetical protein
VGLMKPRRCRLIEEGSKLGGCWNLLRCCCDNDAV